MRKLLSVIAIASLLLVSNTNAAGLDLSLSNETANFEVSSSVRKFTRGDRGGQLRSSGEVSVGLFYNDLDDVIAHGKLIAVGKQVSTRVPYQLEYGVKVFVGSISDVDTDVGALDIGGGIRFRNPRKFNPIDLQIEGFFTPGITTFGDTSSVLEINTLLSVEIVPAAKAYIGYRLLEVENDSNETLELDDNIHFGFSLKF